MMAEHITVHTREQAWEEVNKIFPGDYELDAQSSERAGYPTYRSKVEFYDYICDLNTRLEVNLKDGRTINVHIEPTEEQKQIEELTAKVDELQKKLAEATEWKPYEIKQNVSQEEYDKLMTGSGTGIWQDADAIEWIANDFGFEPKKIEIVKTAARYEKNSKGQLRSAGTAVRVPLYNASDWNYVRFDCGCMSWELINGELRPFYR